MKRQLILTMVLLFVFSLWVFGSALKSGSYIGWDSDLIKKSNANMTVSPGRLSFWGNVDVSLQVNAPDDGFYKFILSAWGSPAEDHQGNKWPIMKLTVGDRDICTWEVTGQKALYISNVVELRAGEYEVKIAFINDCSTDKEDRNLFLDGIAFGGVKQKDAAPVLMFQGRPVATFGTLVEGKVAPVSQQAAKKGIEPYYPTKMRISDYSPKTISSRELALKLKNGMQLGLEQFDTAVSLDGDWKISGLTNNTEPFPEDVDLEKGYWRGDFDDGSWDTIKVPLDWYAKYAKNRIETQPYVKGWYRKNIDVPQDKQGKRVIIKFDVIGYEATLYVNGNLAGSHHGDFTPWEIDITQWVNYGAKNTLAIRVLTDFGPTFGVTKPAKHTYGSQWSIGNIKGGLWQSVSLRYNEPIYLQRVLISPILAKGTIEIDYWIENHSQKKQELGLFAVVSSAMKADQGLEVANVELGKFSLLPGTNQGRAELKLNNPNLWSPENPYLYYLTLALVDQQRVITARAERFGFREFTVKDKDFYLNGERIYLFGENLPSVRFGGYGASEGQNAKELAGIMVGFKRQGYNIIRNPHMPIIPLALKLADEIGMMIYNEWAWSFTNTLDSVEFEQRNLKELEEWVYRDYNYPSVVIWSCGNEVRYSGNKLTYDQLNKQVTRVRELDRSRRPISSFSGAAYGYGTEKLDTDVIDLHTYLGLSSPAWTNWEANLESVLELDKGIYGENGKLNKPFIIWECVGYSWGQVHDPKFTLNNIDNYASYAEKPTTWALSGGIGFAGTIGLAAALDPNRSLKYGREHYGKRTMELIRYQHENVQGFAPWFHDYTTSAAALWNQPLFAGLRDNSGGVPLTNLFAGKSYQQTFFLTNSQEKKFNNLEVKLVIVGLDGKEKQLKSFSILELLGWQKQEQTLQFKLPGDLAAGSYQIRLTIFENGKEISRNFYDVFVQEQKILTTKIETKKRVALLEANAEVGVKTKEILTNLGIQFAEVADLGKLDNYDVLIIPSTNKPYQLFDKQENNINLMAWVRNGGLVLQLEQNYFQQTPIGQTLLPAENTFVDLAIPAHPAFKGLNQENFDTWQNPNRGYCILAGFQPFTVNALAVRGPFLGSRDVTNAVAEGTYGKGRIFASQLLASAMWGIDSAATTYLWNVFSYLLQKEPYEGVRGWVSTARGFNVVGEQVIPIDLRANVNRGFKDEVDGDEKGGWTDQGDNDFRMMPLGKQVFAGVTFEIIDPAENNDRSCIVLSGGMRPYFPESCEGIVVDEHLSRLFFLQTVAWSSGKKVGEYQIKYTDGSVAKVEIIDGVSAGDWWFPGDLPKAQIGLIAENTLNHKVGLWIMEWENPWPEKKIAAIDLFSTGASVPVLVAISGEKANLKPLVVDDFETETKWATLSDGQGAIPTVDRCEKQSSPENVLKGNVSLKVTMPEKTAAGTPVIFGKFPLERLQAGEKINYLTFWLKADNPGSVSVVLPKDDWSSRLSTELVLRAGEWQKVRLNLKEDMGLKDVTWGLEKLRGELFFYNRNTAQKTVFYLDEIQFE